MGIKHRTTARTCEDTMWAKIRCGVLAEFLPLPSSSSWLDVPSWVVVAWEMLASVLSASSSSSITWTELH